MTLNKQYYNAFLKNSLPKDFKIEFKDDDTFILTSTTLNKDGKPCKVRLDLRILPILTAKNMDVGAGRNEPNTAPYLPPPVGRIEFSLNPFKMLVSTIDIALFCDIFANFFTISGSIGWTRIPIQDIWNSLCSYLLRSLHHDASNVSQ